MTQRHRFNQIRFAAAVRPDHAGQSRLDQKIGRLDEGLEAEQAQSRELHELELLCSRIFGDWNCPIMRVAEANRA